MSISSRSNSKIALFPREEADKFIGLLHCVTFGEPRPTSLDRYNFACVYMEKESPVGWVTCLELDAESIYVQHGGVIPEYFGTGAGVRIYKKLLDYLLEHYVRVGTRVDNRNRVAIKTCLGVGYTIVGVSMYGDTTLVEFRIEPGKFPELNYTKEVPSDKIAG